MFIRKNYHTSQPNSRDSGPPKKKPGGQKEPYLLLRGVEI